jgi:hypothetical protein
MKSFYRFISESKDYPMSSSFNEMRGLRHVMNYVAPFLSQEGRRKTQENFSGVVSPLSKLDVSTHGSLHSPEQTHTHYLHSDHNGVAAGTPIHIEHVFHQDGKIYAQTRAHGAVPLNKISKPKGLKKERKGQYGFDVESKIAKNLGLQKAAGSSNKDKDFEIKAPGQKESVVKGKVKEVSAPSIVRGESKLEKGRFGVTTLQHSNGKWGFAGDKKMHAKFAEGRVTGEDGVERSLLEHLDKFHSDGVIRKGFRIAAPKGTARHYVENSDVNSLHIHDKQSGHSTTYTVGNELRGKVNLGHLDSNDLDRLDGTISVEPGAPGKARIAHSPNINVMREYAYNSHTNPLNHKTLENEHHAREFMSKVLRKG